MSPEKNPTRIVSPARAEIEALLFRYGGEVGAGKMDRAATTLAEAVSRLLDLVDPVLSHPHPPPCAPCDVSIPNNPVLIEDFKGTVVDRSSLAAPRHEMPPGFVDAIGHDVSLLKGEPKVLPVVTAPAPKTTKKAKPKA